MVYHDLLDAAARVGRIEERMGYTFKDKMLCIEALKLTSSVIPLYFKGAIHQVDRNNRLALLGDRVLGLALCEVWFQTGNTTADYHVMTQGSETRAVLFTRGQALGIHKNLLLHEWAQARTPSDNQVAETVEAILGAVYLDSGKSIEIVKEVVTNAALDTHKLLKADARSQNKHEKRELASLRTLERTEALRVRRQMRKDATTATSESLASFLIRYKERVKEKRRLKIDKEKSQILKREAQPENRDPEKDSKLERRRVAAASRLSKEGNLLDDGSGQDGPTADSGRKLSPIPRIEDKEKTDTPHEPGNQETPQQNNDMITALNTAVSQSTPLSSQDILPQEELVDLRHVHRRSRLRWWKDAIKERDALKKEKGINVDVWGLYEERKLRILSSLQADRLDAPDKTAEEHPPTKQVTEELGKQTTKELGSVQKHTRREKRRHKRSLANTQLGGNRVAPIKPVKETTQVSASVLPEPITTTVMKADSIRESFIPVSVTIEQERPSTIGSDEADTATSTVPAPAQELSGSLEKINPSTLDASQHATSPILMSGENETITSAAPAQKFSSSPEQPSPTQSPWATRKNRKKPTQELSRHVDDTGFARASATDWDNEKKIVVRTKDVEQLENDILNSHRDIWQANGIPSKAWKPSKGALNRLYNERRSLRNSQILAEQLTGRAPINRTATREEYAGSSSAMQGASRTADENAKPFVRFNFYESNTERFMANLTKDDSVTPDTPRSEPEKKYTVYNPSIWRLPEGSQPRAKLRQTSDSKSPES
ncbi:hypothetical protein G6011_09676 [Alternaria panax]|uniref:RNase III domain-containing protein n=1 Tax=Alternaria panax TaxID=48097 RepID=A0AAD4I5J9_9PLEO|nr:hypothetical protein G6011_09676 [Alternaria panax]